MTDRENLLKKVFHLGCTRPNGMGLSYSYETVMNMPVDDIDTLSEMLEDEIRRVARAQQPPGKR